MIIECSKCESKVDGKILAEQECYEEDDPFPFKASLLQCPVCKNAILAGQEMIEVAPEKWKWCEANRLWPQPEKHISWYLPPSVSASLEEAKKCYKAKAYSACAVMCGRMLESICVEHNTQKKVLAGGLKELLDNQIIDKKIYKWGETLREHRNIGAHATKKGISREDAKDLLDFANAICDYIFVLTAKFARFMSRIEKTANK